MKSNLHRISDGAVQLKAYFAPPTLTQTQLAKALGVTPQAVSNWVRGYSRPPANHREAIERITGISAEMWLLAKEKKDIDNAVDALEVA